MKIGGNDDFQFKKIFEGGGVNPFENSSQKVDGGKTEKTKEATLNEGTSGVASNVAHQPQLDKTGFTNENDIQEIDMSDFKDDFE